MPETVRELAERFWNGEADLVHEHHPVHSPGPNAAEELDDGLLYIKSLASVSTLDTGDGLVMLDTGSYFDVNRVYESVRGWRGSAPLAAAVEDVVRLHSPLPMRRRFSPQAHSGCMATCRSRQCFLF